MSASLKHILLSFEEYERLKNIESEYHKIHKKIEQNLHLAGSGNSKKTREEIEENQIREEENSDNDSSEEIQSGSGTSNQPCQFGCGPQKQISNEDEFIKKIAILVTKKINPRLPETIWNNFNLTSPSTSVVTPSNTNPAIHYDNTINKNDENDVYGKK